MKLYHWGEFNLWDSDGRHPTGDEHRRAMREFRNTGGIRGYFFFNPSAAHYEHADDPAWIAENHKGDRVWDDLNQEFRKPEDVGPDSRDVDFSGID